MAGPIKGPPDFSAGINPNDFTVPGGDQTVSALKQANGAAQSISYDWSGVDSALQGYTGVAQAWDARAGGQGETAGLQVWQGQEDNATNNGISDPRSLGVALMKQSRMGNQQSSQVLAANMNQRFSAVQAAQQARQAVVQGQMAKLQADQQLQAWKNQTALGTQQAVQGYQLAQQELQNQYILGVAGAKNAQQAAQIQANNANWNIIMGYVQSGLQAVSTAAAAGAGFAAGGGNGGNPAGLPNNGQLTAPGSLSYGSGTSASPLSPGSLSLQPGMQAAPAGGSYQLSMPPSDLTPAGG